MSWGDEIKDFLPRYLSDDSLADLFDSLKDFPENIDERMYMDSSYEDRNSVLQGDGIKDLLVVQIPESRMEPVPCVILSNSCDISETNTRAFPSRAVYAPIVRLSKYESAIRSAGHLSDDQLSNHMISIRQQRISNIFYLPNGQRLDYEGLVLLDRLNNCPLSHLAEGILQDRRLFSLSNYGFYLFLFKVSIHFTRIREKIDRT